VLDYRRALAISLFREVRASDCSPGTAVKRRVGVRDVIKLERRVAPRLWK
jgi:hypothetical protein